MNLPPMITLPASAEVALPTDQFHRLVVPAVREVALRLLTFEHQPIAGTACQLAVGNQKLPGTTDAEGRVGFKIVATGESIEARVTADTNVLGWESARPVKVQALSDVATPIGQRLRLDNLGYVPVFQDEPDTPDTPSAWAIEEFQCEHGLNVDGHCGPATQAKLVEAHGH